jgi:hypothetical protein
MFEPGANLYAVAVGTRPENVEVPTYQSRAPTSADTNFPLGKLWLFVGNSLWYLLSQSTANNITTSNWVQLSSSSGTVLSVAGTVNQITSTNAAGAVTLSLPAAITAPGSVTVTSKLNFVTGANTSTGVSGAMTAGSVTVANTSVTANSLIFCYPAALGTVTAPQAFFISAKVAGTSFTITSASATDTSTWNYMIIN